MKRHIIWLEVGVTSCVMFTILLSIGWQGISHLRQLNRKMQEVTGEVGSNEQTVAEVFRLSNSNSRITLSIFLMDDTNAINRLAVQRADNTRRISELVAGLQARPGTEEEKRLLAALEAARKPYLESYEQGLKTLVDNHRSDEARKEMTSVALSRIATYHSAWTAFAQHQYDDLEQAIRQNQTSFVAAQRQLLFQLILACLMTIFVTIRVTQEVARRLRAEDKLLQSFSQLEQQVQQRTAELVQANLSLQAEVSEHKKSEHQLRKLSRAVEQSPASVVITDPIGSIEYVNPKFCVLTGYRREEVRGQNPRFLKAGDMPIEAYRQMWATIAAGQEWHGEFHNRKKNGELYWESATISPLRDDQGRVTHFVAVKEDITERRWTQELLRRSEEKFRGLVENLRDAVMTVDPATHKFRSANPAAIRMFGAKNEAELTSCGPGQLSPERQGDGGLSVEEAGQWMKAVEGGPQRFEWWLRRISGGEFFAEVMLTRMEQGGEPVFLSTIRDITERRQAEETLREKEHLLSESQRLGHIGSWFGDVTGPLALSEETYRMFGVSPDSFIPGIESLLGLIHPEDRPAVLDWETRCAAGQKPDELEFRIKRPDGSIRFIKRNGEAVYDANQRFIHMAGTVQDVTEQKEAQADREKMERELAEHRVNEENARLALEHEQKASQIKDRFVSMVSHEFRTPLSIINVAAKLLDGYLDKMTEAERSEHLEEIQNSVERMTQMMNDFLVHSSCVGNKVECRPEWVEVAALCRRLIAEVPRYAGALPRIECAVGPTVGEAWLDEKILRHIVGNLLSNAVKYSLPGQRVKLEVSRVAGRLGPDGAPDALSGNHLEIKVSDSGIGIPAADLAKLYQTFHRAANVGNRPGTGMGLAIVKQFVDLLGGKIHFESEVGKGTTVWVELPAAAPVPTRS